MSEEQRINWSEAEVRELPLSVIGVDPNQPRRSFSSQSLRELAASIKQNGLLQPITVRHGVNDEPEYVIISGERRYRAHEFLGKETIRAQIVRLDDMAALSVFSLQVLENVAREDLNPIEKAKAFQTLVSAGDSAAEVARKVGTTAHMVTLHIALLNLGGDLQHLVARQRIGLRIAGAMARLSHDGQRKVLRKMTSDHVSPTETRMLCEQIAQQEAQADMFPETVVTEESRAIAKEVRGFVYHFGVLMSKLEKLDEKKAGEMAAALAPDDFLIRAQFDAIRKQLRSIERRMAKHKAKEMASA